MRQDDGAEFISDSLTQRSGHAACPLFFGQIGSDVMDLVIATAAQGVLWGLYALGVYLTYRVLDIADLTVEGSFPLGAAVAASMLVAG